MNDDTKLFSGFWDRMENRFLVWISEVANVGPDSPARVSIDIFGNGFGGVPNTSYDGAAAMVSGAGQKEVVQVKFSRSHSTRGGFSWWLMADRRLAGEFLLTELLDIDCVYDGKVQFLPNQAFHSWIQGEGGGRYLVRGSDWIGMLSFKDVVAPHIGCLKVFSVGPVSWDSDKVLVSVDSEECRGELIFNQGSGVRNSSAMGVPAEHLETNTIHNEAWEAFRESGMPKISCPTCGSVICFEVLSESGHKSTCVCGRFNCVTRM